MASSDENPAATADALSDGTETSDGEGAEKAATNKPKKTLIGLGKLRESLKKASSGSKSTALRIPKPPGKGDKGGSTGLPRPPGRPQKDDEDRPRKTLALSEDDSPEASSVGPEDEPTTDRVDDVPADALDPDTDRIPADLIDDDDLGPTTDRVDDPDTERIPVDLVDDEIDGHTDRMSSNELSNVPGLAGGAPGAGDSSLLDDVKLDDAEQIDEPVEAEATMLTESPFEQSASGFGAEPASGAEEFEGEATMITDSPLDAAGPAGDADLDFGAEEATMITDSPLADEQIDDDDFDGVAKTTVSLHGAPIPGADQPSTPQTHRTNPNPPTPEHRPRNSAPSPNVQVDAQLIEDSDASDDDFHAEKTEVFDSPYENEALVARLSVLSGPAAGQEFLLNKQRNTIGRGKNNTIIVSDLAMSRQHLEVAQDSDQTYMLIDLQSANGTRLNNTSIVEAELFHGDRIEAGKTEFQFVIPGNRPQARSRNRHIVPKREASKGPANRTMVRQMGMGAAPADETTDKILTYVIVGAGVLSIFLIGAAAYLYLHDSSGPKPKAAATSVENPAAQKLYLQGVDRVKDRSWEKARALFKKVAKTDPKFPGVSAQLERVDREEKAQSTLAKAKSLLEQDNDEQAAKLAATISNESVYYEDAQQLVRKTRQRRIARLYQKAQQAVTDEKTDEAKKYLAAILDEVPNHKGALELQKTLAESAEEKEKAREQLAAAASHDHESSSHAHASSHHDDSDWLFSDKPAKHHAASSTTIDFTRGFSLYKAAKFHEASSYFRKAAAGGSGPLASRARTTASNIDRFASAYKRGTRALDAGVWKTAIDGLEDAKRADRSVARTGYFASKINGKLATAFAKLGLGEFGRGKYARAYQNYSKGHRYDRSNSALNELRRRLSIKARSLYIQAANKRKTDPKKAAALCREITSMVPASHSMHQKAKKMLSEL